MSETAVNSLSMPSEDESSPIELTEQKYKKTRRNNWKYGYDPQSPPWDDPNYSDDARQQIWTGHQVMKMNQDRRTFSPAAVLLASSHQRATFYDNVKWDYLGDSKELGKFPEISPDHNQTPFQDIDYNYNKGVLNAFAGNTVIHIRETLDPEATTRSQKLFIVAIDLLAMDVQRLYADDKPQIESLGTPDMRFDEIIPLTSGTLQNMETQMHIGEGNPLKPYLQELFENQATALQPQLVRSAEKGWQYKPEGYAEHSKLRSIEHLDFERGVLWALGQSLGHTVTSRGAIIQFFPTSEITQ